MKDDVAFAVSQYVTLYPSPYYNNCFLVIRNNRVFVEGDRGEKDITIMESPRGANAPLLALRDTYILMVGALYFGMCGVEALYTFIIDPKRDGALQKRLEKIVLEIAKTAEIDTPYEFSN